MENEERPLEEDCVYVIRDCADPDLPILTSDCGINDRVVRAWAQTSYGNHADPATPPSPALICVCLE